MEDILVTQKPVKRGRPRKAVKQEICMEEKEFTPTYTTKYDIENYLCSEISFNEMLPNVIEGYGISMHKGEVILNVNSTSNTLDLRNWKLGRGGIFHRDAKKYARNIETNKYYNLISDTQNLIIRMVSENEEAVFNELNLIDGTYLNTPYTIIKVYSPSRSLTRNFISYSDNNNLQLDIKEYAEKEKESVETEDSLYNNIISSEDVDTDEIECEEI